MDPTSIPLAPATVPFTIESNNHVTPATAVDANTNTNVNPNHPPYDEMIYTAIGALKERDGSSKRAIGKYIEQVYKKDLLPPTHSALLTHHLNRLKSAGLLLMVKKSYKLPGSDPLLPASPSHKTRGRPPKPKPQLIQSAKRGPGRPKKIGLSPGPPVPVPGRRGRPPGTGRSKLPKRPGRPPKPKSVSTISIGLKRRPGRPPKAQSNVTVIPFAAPVAPDLPPALLPIVPIASVPNGSPRPRGRPRKSLPGVGPPPGGRGRGRPRGVLPILRPGRPQKLAVGRPKIPARRPVGRPKGATAAAITAHKAANEDLRKKLELFQSKVKESLGTLKPYFNHESPVTAIAAIQELEVLSNLDLKAPLRDEIQTQVYEQQYSQIPPQPLPQQFFQPHTSATS